MEIHEFADIFPLMNSKEFNDLKKDIKEYGLLEPVLLFDGKILDGRNRYNACIEVNVKPTFINYSGDNPLQHVMSTNLKRRHLTNSQKSIVGMRWKKHYKPDAKKRQIESGEKYGKGVELVPQPINELGKSRDKAGEIVGVSGRYIDMAEEVIKQKPELEEKIMKGEIKLKVAHREIKLEKQREEIKKIKNIKGEYDVIVIDPPWQYDTNEKYDPDNRRGTCPYPTMTIPEIKKIKLPVSDNSVLWLWTTHKFIWDAKQIMEDWGFEYKCILVWNKENLGLGVWLRMQCEFCLVGIKGKPFWDMKNERDILHETKTTHSTKPQSFYDLVDKLCAGRKLDYFARKERKGWDTYGDEVI